MTGVSFAMRLDGSAVSARTARLPCPSPEAAPAAARQGGTPPSLDGPRGPAARCGRGDAVARVTARAAIAEARAFHPRRQSLARAVACLLLAFTAWFGAPMEAMAQEGTASVTADGSTWRASGPTQVDPGDRATFQMISSPAGRTHVWAVRGGEKPGGGRYTFARANRDCDDCLGFLSALDGSTPYRANAASTWAGILMTLSYSNELYVDIPRGSNGGTFEFGFANNSPNAWVNNSTRFTVTVRDVAHVLSTAISSDAGDDSTYNTGDTIEVTVTFNEEVDVTGTPRLGLRIGSNTRSASCAADPDNAANLLCTYAVVSADLAKNGISIAADALSLPTGASIKRQDEDADASLGHGALSAQSDHRVNDAPVIVRNGVSITSTAPGDDSKYDTGDVIEVTVTFDEAVDVHTTPGTPRLALTIGSNTRFAPYAATDSTATALVFAYTVMTDDNDQDGISIAADVLDPNGGDIRRQGDAGVSARLGHSALPTQPAHRVNLAPFILDDGVAVTSTPRTRTDTYGDAETIEISVTFSEAVNATSNTDFVVSVGGRKRAPLLRGSGTETLVFGYTVQAGDSDTDGIWIGDQDRTLVGNRNGDPQSGTITSVATSRAAVLTHGAIGTLSGHKVNGSLVVVPSIVSGGVAITSSPGTRGYYRARDYIQVTVTFSEAVAVDITNGTPRLALSVGSNTRYAEYSATDSAATALAFAYRVAFDDNDQDGISIAANALELNGGAIHRQGETSANARLDHAALSAQSDHRVNYVPFIVSNGVAVTSTPAATTDTYGVGEIIEISVTFSDAVNATTATDFVLSVSGRKRAPLRRGSGTKTLVFGYAVQAGDSDTNGIFIGDQDRTLVGDRVDQTQNGRISSVATDGTAILTHGEIGTASGHKVNGSLLGPQSAVSIAADQPAFTAQLDDVTFTLTRTGSTVAARDVAVALTQNRDLLDSGNLAQTVAFRGGEATATLKLLPRLFYGHTVTVESTLTATVQSGSGYSPGSPTTASTQIGVSDPAVTVRWEETAYTFAEDATGTDATVAVILRTATGVPSPNRNIDFSISTEIIPGQAESGVDYEALSSMLTVEPSDFAPDGAEFTARKEVTLPIVDDALDEPDETLSVILEQSPSASPVLALIQPGGTVCEFRCDATVTITDNDEPIEVTIAADHEAFTAQLDRVNFTLTRTKDPAAALDVAVALTQDGDLIGSEYLAHTVTFGAGEATAKLRIGGHLFAGSTVTGEATLTATVQDGSGYYVPGSPASASTRIRVADPAVTVWIEETAYTFDEGVGADATVAVILRTATGVPVPHELIDVASASRPVPDRRRSPPSTTRLLP